MSVGNRNASVCDFQRPFKHDAGGASDTPANSDYSGVGS